MSQHTNRWKGLVCGCLGAVGGLMAMRTYWQRAAPKVDQWVDPGGQKSESGADPLDDISLFGPQYEQDESSTAALGRISFRWLTGQAPRSKEGRTILSYLIHWLYGILVGGLYGMWRSNAEPPDMAGGLVYATGLWFVGDEIVVPLLGLQKGPTAATPVQHFNRLGAHWSYGLVTAALTQILRKTF